MPYGTLKVDNIIFTNSGVDQTITVSGIVASTSGNLTVTGTVQAQTISGATVTGNAGQFTTITGGTAGFTTVTGTTITGTTINVASGTFTGNLTAAAFVPTAAGAPTNGVYLPSANTVGIATSGTQRITVDASGSVKIGTGAGSQGLLDVRGTIVGFNTIRSYVGSADANASRGFRQSIDGTEYLGIYHTNTAAVFEVNSSERMRITSDGKVGIGTSAPSTEVHVAKTASPTGETRTTLRLTASNTYGGEIVGYLNQGVNAGLAFSTIEAGTATERIRVTPTGVGIGTSSPTAFLNVAGGSNSVPAAGATGASALFGNSLSANTYGLALGATSAGIGYIQAQRADGVATTYNLSLQPNGGNVGIGTTNPVSSLTVVGNTTINANSFYSSNLYFDGTNWRYIENGYAGSLKLADSTGLIAFNTAALNSSGAGAVATVANRLTITPSGTTEFLAAASTAPAIFKINLGEVARIDSSGRLLVGTSSAFTVEAFNRHSYFCPTAGDINNQVIISAVSTGFPSLWFTRTRGLSPSSQTIVQNGDLLGNIKFFGSDGGDYDNSAGSVECYVDGTPGANDMPGRLVFATTADGASTPTERMRITSGGYLKASNTGTYTSGTSTYHELRGNAGSGSLVLQIANTSSTGNGVQIDINSDGTAYAYLIGYSTSAAANRIIIWSNGNVVNTNNSYGAISDIKLKENIVDANSQWSDIKSLQVRNYNLKEGQTHTQIGLVAQEVELVSPGLVTESTDRDAEGNDLGTTTKSVNYSVLYMKAVKALQEAMERIETLEAKVAALEAA